MIRITLLLNGTKLISVGEVCVPASSLLSHSSDLDHGPFANTRQRHSCQDFKKRKQDDMV